MTITDQITALLSADPACNGRVTGETVRAIAEIVSERAAIVAWLREQAVHHRGGGAYGQVSSAVISQSADAIERGDFGAGEG